MHLPKITGVLLILIGIAAVGTGAVGTAAADPGPANAAPAGHWNLDGDARDAASPPHPGRLLGRAQFQASPIGGAGKALWCDGVEVAVEVAGVPDWAAGDFALSLWICPLDLRPAGIAAGADWSLEVSPARGLRFSVGGKSIQTPPDRLAFGQWYHVAAVSRGDATLYVNGQPAARGGVGAGGPRQASPLRLGAGGAKAPLFTGLLDDVRVFARALGDEEVAALTDAGLAWIRPRARAPFDGTFRLDADDVVVWVGGEDVTAAQQSGYLEALLTAASPGKRVLFRDMAWEGDTVFEQWRVLNFSPWPQQFDRVGASVIFVQFGQMESLKGNEGLAEFAAAYGRLLDEFQQRTRRIVLVAPTPFEKARPPAPDLTAHNADLARYGEAARQLAKQRGLLFVDLCSLPRDARDSRPLTRDGVHLTEYGQLLAAREAARQLGFDSAEPATDDEPPRFQRTELEQMRGAIREKNALWRRYWRPTNWAFLNGDRVSQPSSRDHVDQRVRWLPAEVQEFPALIAAHEAKIAAANGGRE